MTNTNRFLLVIAALGWYEAFATNNPMVPTLTEMYRGIYFHFHGQTCPQCALGIEAV